MQCCGDCQFITMGNSCPQEEIEEERRVEVTAVLDQFPQIQRNSMFRGTTARYSDLSVINQDYNRYVFVLKIDGNKEIRVVLPVINELSHRALQSNYKLSLGKDMILDPFEQRLQATLIPALNETTGAQYSMRIVPFKGYNSLAFKRVLEEVYLYQLIQKHFEKNKTSKNVQDPRAMYLWLEDCFVYGVNSDQQAVILLYERVETSLALTAEYRRKGLLSWKQSERLKIERDLFMGCIGLRELDILPRDLRASSIFYSVKQQRYLLAGLSGARQVDDSEAEELMTVFGIETQNEGKLRELISQKQNMGIYRAEAVFYGQLRLINRLLESRRIADELGPSDFKERIFVNIENALLNGDSLESILREIEGGLKGVDRSGELQQEPLIAKNISKLMPQSYKHLSETFLFSAYCSLGYQIEFSEMAHHMIERNNLEGHPFLNARVLKDLGEFYQKYGTGGSEYMLNACVLYCKEAEMDIQKELFTRADGNLQQGEEIYITMSSAGDFEQTMIELKRLRAQLRARTLWQLTQSREKERLEILELMSKTLDLAAELNLPIEKQMRLFLTWGVVHRQCGDKVAAEERFKNGLAVCENSGAFENQQSSLLMKSHFLYEYCLMKLQELQDQHDPLVSRDKQKYDPQNFPKLIEDWLRQSLQIREKESTRPFHSVQCCMLLGKLYMVQSQYLQAKVQLKRALIRLTDIEKTEEVNQDTFAQLHYDLGSVNYKLQDYQESVEHYREAINNLQDRGGDPYWANVIAGNLGLAYLRVGLADRGKTLLQRSKQAIRAQHGAHHYDFLFLTSQEQLIAHSAET